MPEPHASYVAVCGQRCPSLTRVIRRYVHNPDLTECREDCAEQAVLYAYPWRGRPQASTADGPQSRSDCCLSRAIGKDRVSQRTLPPGAAEGARRGSCPVSRIGHPCG